MAECSHDRHIRGLARFDEQSIGEDGFPALLGEGRMAITITPATGKRYQGVVPRERDDLAGCLEDYFERSEQIATRLFLFADEQRAAGLMLQRLPGHTAEDDELWERVNHLARTVEPEELLTLDSETLLFRLFHEETVRVFDPEPVAFRCSCSRERTLGALEAIGKDECYQLLDERGAIEMDCQFCHTSYRFNRNDIDHLFTGHTLH
jgi:molecular chaperone Hsp33